MKKFIKNLIKKVLCPVIALYVKIVYVEDVWVSPFQGSNMVTTVLDWCEKHKFKLFYKTAFYRGSEIWLFVSDLKEEDWNISLKLHKEWKNVPIQTTYYNGWKIQKVADRYYCSNEKYYNKKDNGKRYIFIS